MWYNSYFKWAVLPKKEGESKVSVRGLVTVVIGVVAFVVIDSLITNIYVRCPSLATAG